MNPIQQVLHLDNSEYFVKHLELVNCLLSIGLTKSEIKVLATFMSLDKALIEEDMFNTEARKRVRKELNLSYAGLSNYLDAFIDKKVAVKNDITKRIVIKDWIFPQDKMQGYQIKLTKNNEVR